MKITLVFNKVEVGLKLPVLELVLKYLNQTRRLIEPQEELFGVLLRQNMTPDTTSEIDG